MLWQGVTDSVLSANECKCCGWFVPHCIASRHLAEGGPEVAVGRLPAAAQGECRLLVAGVPRVSHEHGKRVGGFVVGQDGMQVEVIGQGRPARSRSTIDERRSTRFGLLTRTRDPPTGRAALADAS